MFRFAKHNPHRPTGGAPFKRGLFPLPTTFKEEPTVNKTQNYQLNQWEAEDRVLRTDFNADNAKIDEALAGIPKVTFGSYIGDGALSRTIPLPFTPNMVYLCRHDGPAFTTITGGTYDGVYYWGGIALRNAPVVTATETVLEIVENGFKVCSTTRSSPDIICSNENREEFRYFAIG